jgi:methionyl-tRNA formyltransferase
MKLLLLAHDLVGEEVLTFLLRAHASDLALVVTMEDNTLFQRAKAAGVPVSLWKSSRALCDELTAANLRVDLGLLAWWPAIIKAQLIRSARAGFINFHPSFLPFNRGKHYNFWALVEGAPFGVSLHCVDEGVDSGDIIVQREIPYDWTDTGETLYFKAQKEIVRLFCESYPMLRSLQIPRRRQELEKGSFHLAAELTEASRIDLGRLYRGRELLNLLRARTFKGHPACWFEESGKRYEVRVEIKRIEE